MSWPTDRYPTSQEIRDRLIELKGLHPTLCTVADLAEDSHGGKRSNMLRIGRAAVSSETTPRNKVLFVGGVHAREWTPPVSLVNLAEKLLTAVAAATAQGATGTAGQIQIGNFVVSPEDVRAIHEHVDLIIAPMVNPDGYDFSQDPASNVENLAFTSQAHPHNWRKNRRAAPAPLPAECNVDDDFNTHPRPRTAQEKRLMSEGVDLNRNFDVVWNFQQFYLADREGNFQSANGTTVLDGAGQGTEVVGSSKRACDETFIGPNDPTGNPFSEPEARNVKALLESHEPGFYVDCHMFGPDIMFSWGIEENGPVSNPTPPPVQQKLRDGTRTAADGSNLPQLVDPGPPQVTVPRFVESINQGFRDSCQALANIMARATGDAATGNTYRAIPGAQLSSLSGASDDFAFARNLGTNRPACKAFTLESGTAATGFQPNFSSEFPGIEMETHCALLALLRQATRNPSSCCGS
jgi:hypothetical protein